MSCVLCFWSVCHLKITNLTLAKLQQIAAFKALYYVNAVFDDADRLGVASLHMMTGGVSRTRTVFADVTLTSSQMSGLSWVLTALG